MKYVEPGTCAYCKQSQRHANPKCPYNRTAHAQYIGDAAVSSAQSDDTNDNFLPVVAVVAAEVAADTWDSAPASDPIPDTTATFDGFGGGDSGGGGASDSFDSSTMDSGGSSDSF